MDAGCNRGRDPGLHPSDTADGDVDAATGASAELPGCPRIQAGQGGSRPRVVADPADCRPIRMAGDDEGSLGHLQLAPAGGAGEYGDLGGKLRRGGRNQSTWPAVRVAAGVFKTPNPLVLGAAAA